MRMETPPFKALPPIDGFLVLSQSLNHVCRSGLPKIFIHRFVVAYLASAPWKAGARLIIAASADLRLSPWMDFLLVLLGAADGPGEATPPG